MEKYLELKIFKRLRGGKLMYLTDPIADMLTRVRIERISLIIFFIKLLICS